MKFRQLCFEGKIPIWAKTSQSDLWVEVPKEFWKEYHIDYLTIIDPEPPESCGGGLRALTLQATAQPLARIHDKPCGGRVNMAEKAPGPTMDCGRRYGRWNWLDHLRAIQIRRLLSGDA